MPLWNLYHPPGVWSAEDKKQLAEEVTALYTPFGLPKFYVVTLFHEVGPDSFLVGGEPRSASVRIQVDHIARQLEGPEMRAAAMAAANEVLRPFTEGRGLAWEIHVDETPVDLWTIDGQVPPRGRSEQERLWAAENRPVPS